LLVVAVRRIQWLATASAFGVIAACVVGLLSLGSLVAGCVAFGLSTAVNEYRIFFWAFAAIAWGISCGSDARWRRHGTATAFLAGWAVVIVGVWHLATGGLGNAVEGVTLADGEVTTSRILN